MKAEFEVTVIAKVDTGNKTLISIGFPKDQPKLDVRQTSHLLASGIALIIKTCSNNELGISDHELLKEVISHLENEFASTTSFEDAKVDTSIIGRV